MPRLDLQRRAALALCRILERRHPGTRWNVAPLEQPGADLIYSRVLLAQGQNSTAGVAVHTWLDDDDYAVIAEEGPPWREGLDDSDTVGTDMSKLSRRTYSE